MLPSTIGTFGGPKENAEPVENPRTQIGEEEYNKLLEAVAQLTRTPIRALVLFTTTAVGHPVTYASTAVTVRSLWGNGDAYKPTVTKTAAGLYTVQFLADYADALGVSETLGFVDAFTFSRTTDVTDDPHAKVLTVTANSATIAIEEPRTNLADTASSALLMDIGVYFL